MSTQGITKKTPGPLAPPANSLPSLKITALSYSWTTLTTKKREKGRKRMMRKQEKRVRSLEHTPGPSSQSTTLEIINRIRFITRLHIDSYLYHLSYLSYETNDLKVVLLF